MPVTNFFWEPLSDNILQEREEFGALTAEYTTEPGLYGNIISQNQSGVESQFHFDAVGSALAVTDEGQQVTDSRAYSAFGGITESAGDTLFSFAFVGQRGYYQRSLISQSAVRRREYSSALCRWLSPDPQRTRVIYANLYTYSINRPLVFADPSGEIVEVDYSDDPTTQSWNVCGGGGLKVLFMLDRKKLIGKRLVGLFQYICALGGSITDCEPDSSVFCPIGQPCKVKAVKPCGPCCFYEYLGSYSIDPTTGNLAADETQPFDDNHFPRYSLPFNKSEGGCTSKGRQLITRQMRVVVDAKIMLEGASWPEQLWTCDARCRAKVVVSASGAVTEKPRWWDDVTKYVDAGSGGKVEIDWDCCGAISEYQCLTFDGRVVFCETQSRP